MLTIMSTKLLFSIFKNIKIVHVVLYVILGWYYVILGWKFIIIYFFNCQTEKNLIWTNKKFVYLIFIGQKISYFRHYVHVRKSPDDMNKSNELLLRHYLVASIQNGKFFQKIWPFHVVQQFSYMDVMTKVQYFLTNEN